MYDQRTLELEARALKQWGADAQEKMVYEELGELLTALARVGRGRTSHEDLVSEVVDVEVMLHQVVLMYGITPLEYDAMRTQKLDRLEQRLERAGA